MNSLCGFFDRVKLLKFFVIFLFIIMVLAVFDCHKNENWNLRISSCLVLIFTCVWWCKRPFCKHIFLFCTVYFQLALVLLQNFAYWSQGVIWVGANRFQFSLNKLFSWKFSCYIWSHRQIENSFVAILILKFSCSLESDYKSFNHWDCDFVFNKLPCGLNHIIICDHCFTFLFRRREEAQKLLKESLESLEDTGAPLM